MSNRNFAMSRLRLFTITGILCMTLSGYSQQEFGSPKEAAQTLADAVKASDRDKVMTIFGDEAKDLISSGDEVEDMQAIQQFQERVTELTAISSQGETSAILVIGKEAWPFPIPLVKAGDKWKFDVDAGRETLLNRRIGQNEIHTISTLRDLVAAEYQYYATDYDEDGVLEYSPNILSSEGKRDGLYWPEAEDGIISPLGPVFANAMEEGYPDDRLTTGLRSPYHGYYFKILTGQGSSAHGGEFSYVINGNMVAGFAIIAWPVDYGHSGLMTFLTNVAGDVWSADLGTDTNEKVTHISTFNPNENWLLEE